MRNTIFATAIAMAGCVLAAAAHGAPVPSSVPMAWQIDPPEWGIDHDLEGPEYSLENTPNFSHIFIAARYLSSWKWQPAHFTTNVH